MKVQCADVIQDDQAKASTQTVSSFITTLDTMEACLYEIQAKFKEYVMSYTRLANAVKVILLLQYLVFVVFTYNYASRISPSDLQCVWKEDRKHSINSSLTTLISSMCYNENHNSRFASVFLALELTPICVLLAKLIAPYGFLKNRLNAQNHQKIIFAVLAISRLFVLLTPYSYIQASHVGFSLFGFLSLLFLPLRLAFSFFIRLLTLPVSIFLPPPIKDKIYIDLGNFRSLFENSNSNVLDSVIDFRKQVNCHEFCEIGFDASWIVLVLYLCVLYCVAYLFLEAFDSQEYDVKENVSESVEFIRVSEVIEDFNYEDVVHDKAAGKFHEELGQEYDLSREKHLGQDNSSATYIVSEEINDVAKANKQALSHPGTLDYLDDVSSINVDHSSQTNQSDAEIVEKFDKECQKFDRECQKFDKECQTVSIEDDVGTVPIQSGESSNIGVAKVNSDSSNSTRAGKPPIKSNPPIKMEKETALMKSDTTKRRDVLATNSETRKEEVSRVFKPSKGKVAAISNVFKGNGADVHQSKPHPFNTSSIENSPNKIHASNRIDVEKSDLSAESSNLKALQEAELVLESSHNSTQSSATAATTINGEPVSVMNKTGDRVSIKAATNVNRETIKSMNRTGDTASTTTKTVTATTKTVTASTVNKVEPDKPISEPEETSPRVELRNQQAKTALSVTSPSQTRSKVRSLPEQGELAKLREQSKFSFSELSIVPPDLQLEEKIKQKSLTPQMNVEDFLTQLAREQNKHQVYIEKELLMKMLRDVVSTARVTGTTDCDFCPVTKELVRECTCRIHQLIKSFSKDEHPEKDLVDGRVLGTDYDEDSDDESFFGGFRL